MNGRPKPARKKRRLMTDEEWDAHEKQRQQANNETRAAKRRAEISARQLELNEQSASVAQSTGTLGASSAADSSGLPSNLNDSH